MRDLIAKHQLSGVDERDRGFSRQVSIECVSGSYLASLQYEKTFVTTDGSDDEVSALGELIQRLQNMGYGQLQTQRSFAGGTYLGTQEACVEYPDPERPEQLEESGGILAWICRILSPS